MTFRFTGKIRNCALLGAGAFLLFVSGCRSCPFPEEPRPELTDSTEELERQLYLAVQLENTGLKRESVITFRWPLKEISLLLLDRSGSDSMRATGLTPVGGLQVFAVERQGKQEAKVGLAEMLLPHRERRPFARMLRNTLPDMLMPPPKPDPPLFFHHGDHVSFQYRGVEFIFAGKPLRLAAKRFDGKVVRCFRDGLFYRGSWIRPDVIIRFQKVQQDSAL